MPNKQDIKKNPWQFINTLYRRKLAIINIGANLAGAGIVTFYFLYLNRRLEIPVAKSAFIVIGIILVGLIIIGAVILGRWQKDQIQFVDLKMHNQAVDLDLQKKVQRKILNLPYVSALTSLFDWFLAANIMAIYTSINLIEGSFAVEHFFEVLRTFIGVIIAGISSALLMATVRSSLRQRASLPTSFPI